MFLAGVVFFIEVCELGNLLQSRRCDHRRKVCDSLRKKNLAAAKTCPKIIIELPYFRDLVS